ncbi:hypothetical protein NP233_g4743 [Leucocoprinus birnbaumii]|uniref:Nephrocystin 3-like N-terminal domain-containing protein n=1 Tax=Leucocoprinus birnbaumii TaxID=56174 RepID=A0AAD5VWG5_9AGAR|nr:hypothetical protein NP233_g4743 [Leucocoprinus birnbaumii]
MIEQFQFHHEQPKVFPGELLCGMIRARIKPERTQALAWLEGHAMSGVEYNSSARDPLPRCHEGTRLWLLKAMRSWLCDPKMKQRLVWLHGPAGVGKSAITQTFAELLSRNPIVPLGATIFLPWPTSQDSPLTAAFSCDVSAMWLTVAYRLSTTQPAYRSYVVERIENDPRLVEQAMEFQFETFIVEPFGRRGLLDEGHKSVLPILIDGLDRCQHPVQQKIVELILKFVEEFPESRLVWILTGRNEMHLIRLFESYRQRLGELIQPVFVPIEAEECLMDARIFMRGKFAKMSEEYVALDPHPWPTEKDFNHILGVALGLFILVSAIVDFIGNPHIADPVSQLSRVMIATKGESRNTGELVTLFDPTDPLAAVNDMYRQIMRRIPPQAYHTAKRILGFYLLRDGFGAFARDTTSFWELCNILGIKENLALGCLFQLHSLINVPRRENAADFPIRFFHNSFADFLVDRKASRDCCIDLNEVVKDLWQCHLRILKETNVTDRLYPQPFRINLAWPHSSVPLVHDFQIRIWENARLTFLHHLLPCPTQQCAFGVHLPDAARDELALVEILAGINFSIILDGYVCTHVPHRFITFIHWLYGEEHLLLQQNRVLFKLDQPLDNYDWINADAVSFLIRSVRYDDGGCLTTFEAYTQSSVKLIHRRESEYYQKFLAAEYKNNDDQSTAAKDFMAHALDVVLPNGLERTQLFSARVNTKPFNELIGHLESRCLKDLVVVGSEEIGRCAFIIDKPSENETVYYVLPVKHLPTMSYMDIDP